MRSFVYCFSFFSLLYLLASCQHEPDETLRDPPTPTDPVTPPVVTNDSIYIKTMVAFDAGLAPGADTVDKWIFHYDGLKRLDSLDWYEYTITHLAHNFEKRYYWGTDTLPYKLINAIETDPGVFQTETIFFQYQNGVVISDSTISVFFGNTSTNVREYTVYSNEKFGLNKYKVSNGILNPGGSVISVQIRQNGNLVSQLDTSDIGSLFPTGKTIREFDNHPDPFRRINIPYCFITMVGFTGSESFLEGTMSINNETRNREEIVDGWINDYSRTYKYRADGYPVEALETWTNGYQSRILYTYEK